MNPPVAKQPTVQAAQYVQTVKRFEGSEKPRDPDVPAQKNVFPRLASLGTTANLGSNC